MKPVCFKCHRFYKPKKNGYYFTEGMPIGNGVKPGLVEAENWRPYKLWVGDLWECPTCHAQIIVGVNWAPILEHYQPEFPETIKRLNVVFQVNDC